MNIQVGEILKDIVKEAKFADKVAGLVQAVSVNMNTKDGQVLKTYPVSCTATYDQVNKGGFTELTPDAKYKSLMYFEDNGITLEREGRYINAISSIKFVCWANLKKLGAKGYSTTSMIREILYLLPTFPKNYGDMLNFYVEATSQDVRDSGVFSKYTYDEQMAQYLFYPYDYFALNLTVTFKIAYDCLDGNTKHCC